jgi:biotin carboxyl carrier protein
MKFSITIKDRTYDVDVQKSSGGPGRYRITVDGTAFEASVKDGTAGPALIPSGAPAGLKAPASPPFGGALGGNRITAPMPGTIVAVHASAGDRVKQGQEVITMETMKMNVPLFAPADGTLKSVSVKAGDSVTVAQVLAEIET